jgi:hypothetical protein
VNCLAFEEAVLSSILKIEMATDKSQTFDFRYSEGSTTPAKDYPNLSVKIKTRKRKEASLPGTV